MIQLVTLDAAGTLIDHRWDPGGIATEAARATGREFNRDHGREVYRAVAERYRPEQELLERAGDRGAIHAMWQRQMADWLVEMGGEAGEAPQVLGRFQEIAFGPRSHVFTLFDDVMPTLAALRGHGFRLGVVSNWDHTLFGVLDSLGIEGEFDFVIASLVFGTEKPDPAIFLKACEQGNSTPAQTLHVGDSIEDDFEGAINAGLNALLLDREREANRAQGRIASLTEISEVIQCSI